MPKFRKRGRIQAERKNLPALNIKDPEVHDLARELARRTKRSLTQAVKDSLRESIARRIASRPVLDTRASDEILGYNDSGLPE
jgi:antitoxin VapB